MTAKLEKGRQNSKFTLNFWKCEIKSPSNVADRLAKIAVGFLNFTVTIQTF